MPCPSCGGSALSRWAEKNGYALMRCHACELIFVSPMPAETKSVYGEEYFFGGEEHGYVDYDRDKEPMRPTFEKYLARMEKALGRKGRLLDVGCATGYFMEVARERGWHVEGIDISEAAVARGRAKGLTIFTGVLPHAELTPHRFDAVTIFDVIEHVPDPAAVVAQCRQLLKKGGILVATAPDAGSLWARMLGTRWHLIVPPEHLVFFNRRNFAALLKRNGFTVQMIMTIGKSFTFPYVFRTLFRWQGLSLWRWLEQISQTTVLKRFRIPINLHDTFFVIAKIV